MFHFIHSYIALRDEYIVMPKLGPYDPRDDKKRTRMLHVDICVKCGKIRKWRGTNSMGPGA